MDRGREGEKEGGGRKRKEAHLVVLEDAIVIDCSRWRGRLLLGAGSCNGPDERGK